MTIEDQYFLRYCHNKVEAGWPLTEEEKERYWSLVPVLEVSEEEFDTLQKLLEDDTIQLTKRTEYREQALGE